MFSASENVIYCFEGLGPQSDVVILDSNLNVKGKIYGFHPDAVYKNLIAFTRKGKLIVIDPEKAYYKFNNTIPEDVSRWVLKTYGKLPDSLSRKYSVSTSFTNTLQDLITDKY
jgi:hypothetical protein